MPETQSPTLVAREERKRQKLFQDKKRRMATSWLSWSRFYKELEAQPAYSREIHRAVARISGEIAVEKNGHGRTIRWDEARERILTQEFLQRLQNRFGKSFATIHHDVGKVASHASWLAGIYRRGDGRILHEVAKELREASGDSGPVIASVIPPPPRHMTVAQIKETAQRIQREREVTQREFLGPPEKKAGTQEFSFVADVDRQIRFRDLTANGPRRKKPRRNWRKEL